KHLSSASSLCGACTETCPVKIDLAHHLLQNRRNASRQKPSLKRKIGFKVFAFIVRRPHIYTVVKKLGRFAQKFHPLIERSRLDPLCAWTKTRELPPIAAQTFTEYWNNRA
ncbi:MAG TPA: lactate utilization protein LutB domain-containing protein, partial [Tepidisphaeraceae bacterium]